MIRGASDCYLRIDTLPGSAGMKAKPRRNPSDGNERSSISQRRREPVADDFNMRSCVCC